MGRLALDPLPDPDLSPPTSFVTALRAVPMPVEPPDIEHITVVVVSEVERRIWVTNPVPTPDMPGAVCTTVDPELFTGIRHGETWKVRAARRICESCPELLVCREWGLDPRNAYLDGVVGGLTFRERRNIRAERRSKEGLTD